MGYYYAMIKPNEEDKWFRFDNDKPGGLQLMMFSRAQMKILIG